MADRPDISDYDRIACLPPPLIAWEYLRRNAAYRRDWENADRPRRTALDDGAVLIEAPGPSPAAGAWGLEVFFRSGESWCRNSASESNANLTTPHPGTRATNRQRGAAIEA